MAPGDIVQIFIVIILLLLSAFFSSAETALTTVNRVRMRTLADDGNKKAQRVLDITDNKAKMLSAILIGNNVVNLSASSLLTTLATNLFGSQWIALSTGVLTFLILIFGEIFVGVGGGGVDLRPSPPSRQRRFLLPTAE